MTSGKTIAGILLGVAAGAVAGILLAPDKGTETRRKVAEKSADLAESIKGNYKKYEKEASEKFSSAKGKVNEYATEAKQKTEEYLNHDNQRQSNFNDGNSGTY